MSFTMSPTMPRVAAEPALARERSGPVRPPAVVDPGPALVGDRLARYSRQLLLPGFGEEAQRRLANARVLVVGAGGLGSASIPYLAGAGVGTIGVLDTDVVELSNLHRQVSHGVKDLGRRKARSIADTVAAIDPEITVRLHEEWLDSSNALELFSHYDLIMDGSDNFATRYLTNDAAALSGLPLVWGAILQFAGQAGVAYARFGPTYRDLFPSPPAPGKVPSCAVGGVLPSVCATIGSIMSAEAIKLITGIGEPLIGRVTTYDALTGRFRELEYGASDEVQPITELVDYEALCGVQANQDAGSPVSATGETIDSRELASLLGTDVPLQVIDVREPFERAIVTIEPSELFPLGRLGSHLDEIRNDVPVVLYCHHGVRSEHALRMLQGAGFSNVRHLLGGIDDYAAVVDPTMARY